MSGTTATISNQGFAYPTPAAFVKAGCYMEQQIDIWNDPLMKLFPARYEPNADMIVFQYDNIFCGVQQYRGIGGALPVVNLDEAQRECAVLPGYWGEESYVNEIDLTRRAVRNPPNGCVTPVDITDLVSRRQNWLLRRRHNLLRKLAAESLVYGNYEAIDSRTGAVLMRQKYNINEATASLAWSDPINSTPWVDLMNWRDYYEQQTMHKFGCCARMLMNRRTYSKLIKNTNKQNWGVLKGDYCCQEKTLAEVNALLCDHDLPQIEIYNESYFDCDLTRGPILPTSGGVKRFFLPDDYVVIVGCTDDGTLGNTWFTRNVNTCSDVPDAGPVTMVIDECSRPPRKISVLDYWNGGLGISCPRAVISAVVR